MKTIVKYSKIWKLRKGLKDNNNKPRNVLKREEYEILALKKKSEKSNLKKIIMFEIYVVLSFSTHVKYERTFKYRVVYLYMIINLRCNHQHLCTNFTNIDDHVYIFWISLLNCYVYVLTISQKYLSR